MKLPLPALSATRIALLAGLVVAAVSLVTASGPAAQVTGWRASLHVEVDRSARMFVDGVQVDTLRVYRGQYIYWKKRDAEDPDLKIQFERKLIRERHRVRIVVSDDGRPRFWQVNYRARLKTYRGYPEEGFVDDGKGLAPLLISVVSPPE